MSDQRTHRWGSGRLIRTSLRDFWQAPKSLDAADPEIPNLPLETPAAAETSATRAQSSGAPFRTRTSSSRKRVPTPTQATFTPASQPAVFPVAALGGAVVRRRRDTTNRRQIELGDITSALVAPLIGALPRPKANVVWFERTIRLPQPLAIYPPPTGPPQPVFDAPTAHRRVSQRRRLFVPEQADFAAASVPPSDAQVSGEPFRTVKSRSRKRQHDLPAPFFTVATPPATVTLPAPTVKRRHDGERRLQQPLLAAFTPATPGTSPVTIAALAARKINKRRQRHGLLLSGGAGIFDSPAVTYAVTPAALHKQGQFKRRDTERRLQSVTPLAEFTVAASPPSDALVTGEAFRTRLNRSRRMVRQPTAASFDAAPPVTAPVVALPIPKANRRRPRRGVLLTGGDGVFQPPYIVLPAPKAFRVEHRRKLVKAPPLASFTAATPAPAQPTFSQKVIRRRETRRELVRLTPLATYTFAAPPTFPVVALPAPKAFKVAQHRKLILPPVWVDAPATPAVETPPRRGGGRPRPNRSAYPKYKRPRLNEQIDALLESVSAEMAYEAVAATAPAAVKAEAATLIQPYADTTVDVVDWAALEEDAKRVGALMALWAAEQARLKRIRDDDEWLMWEG